MLEFLLAIGLGVVAWIVLKAFRGKRSEGAAVRPQRADKSSEPPDSWPAAPDPVTALQDLPRRLYIEYRAPEGGVSRRDVDVEALQDQDGHLYLSGYCHFAKDHRSFRADRIVAFTDRHNGAVFKGARVIEALEAAAAQVAIRQAAAVKAAIRDRGPDFELDLAGVDEAGVDEAGVAEAGIDETEDLEIEDREVAREAAARLQSEQARALEAFHEWVGRDDWLLMACNASGLDESAEIIEIAVISARGETLLQRQVLPQGPISGAAAAAHGLSAETLRGAPIWPRLHREVMDLLAAAPYVLSYNALFQLRILEQTVARYDLALAELEFDCVKLAYAAYRAEPAENGEACWHSLAEAATHEGVEAGSIEAKGALGDALRAWHLIQKVGGSS